MKKLLLVVGFVYFIHSVAWVSYGAPTNSPPSTNAAPGIDTISGAFPATKEQFWTYGIAAITPVIVWAFGKIPMLPRPILPVLTPFVGMLLGFILQKLNAAHLHWYSAAGAGTIAVFLREATNQLVTKQLKPREDSKTAAKPIDGAVVVHAATVTPIQAADAKLPPDKLADRSSQGEYLASNNKPPNNAA